MKYKALFLDRDGVINIDNSYVYKKKDFKFIDGIFDFVRYFYDLDYKIIIVTNQSGIGRGLFSLDSFNKIMRYVEESFNKHEIEISKIYYCPHHLEEGIGKYKKDCDCRKPKPGMILKASKELEIDLSKSILVGDSIRDINAGLSAEVKNNFLITHNVTPYSKKNIAAIKNKNNVFVCDNFDQIKIQANSS